MNLTQGGLAGLLLVMGVCCGGGGSNGPSASSLPQTQPQAPATPTPSLTLNYPSLPTWTVGTPIASLTPTIGNATSSLSTTFAVSSGSLPGGLALSATTGAISGTPTTAGAFSATVRATNDTRTADAVLSGTVSAASTTQALTLAYALPVWVVNKAIQPVHPTLGYEAAGVATTYAVTSGALPAGLSLGADGTLSGTPTAAGTRTFTIRATNGSRSADSPLSATVSATTSPLIRSLLATGNQARLQRLIAKGRAGTPITFAAIGGSITEGALATAASKRYVYLVQSWWHTTFPNSACTLVNAGIGATASDYGCLRVQHDVLSKKPDLVVVEFAVNDAGTIDEYGDTYEGLLRQLLNAPSRPAVIALFMMQCGGYGSQDWQSTIAAHYDLPMVSYMDAMFPETTDGGGTLHCQTDLSPDGTHPNDTGHGLVEDFVTNLLQTAITAFAPTATAASLPATPSPLRTDVFEFTSLQDGSSLAPTTNKGWTLQSASGDIDQGLESTTVGSTLDFKVTGSRILFSYVEDNIPFGQASVSVDGGAARVLDAYAPDGFGGFRAMANLGTFAPGSHTVHVTLLGSTTSGGTPRFRVVAVGTGGVQ